MTGRPGLPPQTAPHQLPPPTPTERAAAGGGADQVDDARAPFTIVDAGMVLLLFFVGQLIVVVGVGIAAAFGVLVQGGGVDDPQTMASDTVLVIAIIATLVGTGMGLGWLALRGRLDRRLWGPGRHGPLKIVIGIALGATGTVVTYMVNAGVALVFEPDEPVVQQVLQDALAGGRQLVLAATVIVVLAPVTEELVFRGVMFPALGRRIGVWPAAVVSSLMFCAIHVEVMMSQPLALIGMFVLSMILAWSFHATGSLVVPILIHAVFNGFSLALMLTIDRFPDFVDMFEAASIIGTS